MVVVAGGGVLHTEFAHVACVDHCTCVWIHLLSNLPLPCLEQGEKMTMPRKPWSQNPARPSPGRLGVAASLPLCNPPCSCASCSLSEPLCLRVRVCCACLCATVSRCLAVAYLETPVYTSACAVGRLELGGTEASCRWAARRGKPALGSLVARDPAPSLPSLHNDPLAFVYMFCYTEVFLWAVIGHGVAAAFPPGLLQVRST